MCAKLSIDNKTTIFMFPFFGPVHVCFLNDDAFLKMYNKCYHTTNVCCFKSTIENSLFASYKDFYFVLKIVTIL